jgi:hypothetical protein
LEQRHSDRKQRKASLAFPKTRSGKVISRMLKEVAEGRRGKAVKSQITSLSPLTDSRSSPGKTVNI